MAAVAYDTGETAWSGDDLAIETAIKNDISLQEVVARFENDLNIELDTNLNTHHADYMRRDSDSASSSSNLRDNDVIADGSSDESSKPISAMNNGDLKTSKGNSEKAEERLKPGKERSKNKKDKDDSKSTSDTDSLSSKRSSSPSHTKNPLKLLRRLTKFDKSSKKSSFTSEFSTVSVDKLPQIFVAKYLGHREVGAVSGLHVVRKPVDEMVLQIRAKLEAKEEIALPLLYVVVSSKGLDLREHPSSKAKDSVPLGVMPIDFISYGVQDIKYWRVFTCIVVRTLSWQSRSATCHAFLCDSPHNGRKMALALGAAFGVYAKKLKSDGKRHNFQVELRPPDQLADEVTECDA